MSNDLTGQRFGKLTVLGQQGRKHSQILWLCKCDCGNTHTVVTGHLRRGGVQSCGCLTKRRKSESSNWKGVGDLSAVRWHVMKNKAARRGLEFSVTAEFLWKLFQQQNAQCALSGVLLNLGTFKGDYGSASLDRIDSTKGYTEGNVQWVHRVVNFMKQSLTDAELIEWCRKVVAHAS